MTNETDGVDFAALRALYGSSEAASGMFDHFASRERNWGSTTVDRIQDNVRAGGLDVSRGDVIAVFKELEKCGCGTFKVGRKGWASRFEWEVQMVGVGKAAAGEIEEVEKVLEEDSGKEEEGLLKHTFRLRPEVPISLELPKDLTANEGERLAAFIRTLPFSPEG